MKELTLLIGSCDNYASLWPICADLIQKYWEIDCDKIIVAENYSQSCPQEFKLINAGCRTWTERMLYALDSVKTPYVFFILEDYFLSERVSKEMIDQFLFFLKIHEANKIALTTIPEGFYKTSKFYENLYDNIYKMDDDSDYLTSVQPAIWKTSFLKELLQQDNWNPWEFEIIGSARIKGKDNKIFIKKKNDPIYFNAVRKGGYFSEGYFEFIEKELNKEVDKNH